MDWESVSQDQLEEALDHFAGLSAAGWARVCELISVVDARQSWMADGPRTLADWVAAKLRLRHSSARRLVDVARLLVDLPVVRGRFAAGDLSFDQVDAICRLATAETELSVIERVSGLSNTALDRLVRRRRGIDVEEAGSVWERRRLVRQWNLDESELRFHGRLPGDEGRVFDQAIDERVDQMPVNAETGIFDPLETRAADALTGLAADGGTGSGSPTPFTVFVGTDGRGELDNTAPLSKTAIERLACDAVVEPVLISGGQIIGVGRRSRKIPGWLRRLVVHRDGGCCQFPGCGNRRWLQVHHIISWAQGGATDLGNLILVCGFHHRFVHEHGWKVTGPPERRVFRRPDWTPFPRPREPLDPRLRELVRTI